MFDSTFHKTKVTRVEMKKKGEQKGPTCAGAAAVRCHCDDGLGVAQTDGTETKNKQKRNKSAGPPSDRPDCQIKKEKNRSHSVVEASSCCWM